MNTIDIIPEYDIENINLFTYTNEIRKTILSNLKNYTKLKMFICSSCNLYELPDLPISITHLDCSYNKLIELPDLSFMNSLVYLSFSGNNFKIFPDLKLLYSHNLLKYLDCSSNSLTELPELPNLLTNLYCSSNKLRELPIKLPNSLILLFCSYNNLINLPNLPNSLQHFDCRNNNLKEMPDLPNSLKGFVCNNNKLNYTYLNENIQTINETNSKKRIIKKMKLLNRTLLLENSARISLNPKRIQRLLDNLEIDFFDGSFDNLTF